MKSKVIIYDFDGVVVNSRNAVYMYYDAIFEKFELPLIDWHNSELGRKAFGMTNRQLMALYAEGDRLDEMCRYVPPLTTEQLIEVTLLEAGAKEMIPDLARDYHLTICTNRGESVNHYLSHYGLESYFSYIVTSVDVAAPKPSPEGALKILETLELSPAEAVFVGDSEVDYYAAKEAGIKFISFGTSLFDTPVIKDHRELKKYL